MICCCLWILVIGPFYCVWLLLPLLTQCNMFLSHAVPKTRVMVCLLFLRQIFIYFCQNRELSCTSSMSMPCGVTLLQHSLSLFHWQHTAVVIWNSVILSKCLNFEWQKVPLAEILVLVLIKSLLLYCVLDAHHQKSCPLWYILTFDKQWANSIFFK